MWHQLIFIALISFVASAQGSTTSPPASAASQPATPAMTNADVSKLVASGLSDAFVVARIRQSSGRAFDLSPDALIQLKRSGVSEVVLGAMLDPGATATAGSAPASTPIAGTTPAPSMASREPGIYLEEPDGSEPVPLEPTVFSQGKSGGVLASALTYGLYKAKWKAVIRSRNANIRTRVQQPTFLFFFEQKNSTFGAGSFAGWLASASSPNEFVLAQMTEKKNDRELIVGEAGSLGASTGTRSQDTVPIKVDRLAPGVYRVSPTEVLGPGEFCFFYSAGAATLGQGAIGKLFDFGVDGPSGPAR